MRIEAEKIDVTRGGRRVLAEVSMALAPGRVTGIVGPNGAGKSTLIRALAGLQPLASGRIMLDGRPLADLSAEERALRIAYLPQDRTVHWPLAARRVVALGRLPHRKGRSGESAGDATAIEAAMAAMDVAGLAERPVLELSGGERARVLLARALAQESPIVLADEPTAGLDPAHALDLFGHLGRLALDGRAIAVVLHDLSLAARFCHEIVVLSEGRVAAAGPAADVLRAGTLTPVFGVRIGLGMLDGVPVVVPLAALSRPLRSS